MKQELQYKNGFDRQKKFHGSDYSITVEELWNSWKYSEGIYFKKKKFIIF